MSLAQVTKSALTTGGTTQTSPAISTTAGNALAFFAVYNAANAGVVTPSDSTSLTWVQAFTYAGTATGLQLTCWIAKNIAGNAANTFTLATTGSDTPTIFVAEFSGRSKNAPFDIAIGAYDTTTISGAHTTGTLTPGARNDDVIAFTVSSTLSQTYTASGAWVIPANGSVTNATGYDAFVQSQNNLTASSVANTYSVALADKLDAIIVGLQVPQQPYSDEYFDYFNEVPEVYEMRMTVQQQDLQPQILDVDPDWNNEADDNEAWLLPESFSGVVVADVVVAATNQYFGEDAEQFDEAIESTPSPSGYQQSDSGVALLLNDEFDWLIEVLEDNTPEYETAPVVPDVAPSAVVIYNDDLDCWDDTPEVFHADDFGNDDADLPSADSWNEWWDTAEVDNWADVDDQYVTANASITPTVPALEDAWDYGQQEEDEYPTPDDWLGADNNPALNAEDPTWWDEEPDQLDGTTNDLDAVGPDNNREISGTDGWDHFTTDDDDYFIVDEYAFVDVAPVPLITVEDAWDHFTTDDDDYFIVDEYPLITVAPVSVINAEDFWDHFPTDEDDCAVIDEVLVPDGGAASVQYPVLEAWETPEEPDDDWAIPDDYALLNNTPLGPDDAWDHFITDPDDESFLALDADPVPVPQFMAIEDAWGWAQDDETDDDTWLERDTDRVPPEFLPHIQDDWQHWLTDDDDYDVTNDYAIIDNIPAYSQPVEDAWQYFEDDFGDNDCDFGAVELPLAPSTYQTNLAFIVYLPYRPFTVVWIPRWET